MLIIFLFYNTKSDLIHYVGHAAQFSELQQAAISILSAKVFPVCDKSTIYCPNLHPEEGMRFSGYSGNIRFTETN